MPSRFIGLSGASSSMAALVAPAHGPTRLAGHGGSFERKKHKKSMEVECKSKVS